MVAPGTIAKIANISFVDKCSPALSRSTSHIVRALTLFMTFLTGRVTESVISLTHFFIASIAFDEAFGFFTFGETAAGAIASLVA